MNTGWKLIGTLPLLASLIVGCAGEEDSIKMATTPVVKSKFIPVQLWSSKVGDGVGRYFSKLTPVIAYDKVFAADRNGIVSAIDLQSGRTLWCINFSNEMPTLFSGGITASYRKLYLGTETGELIVLDEKTGVVVWRTKTKGEILSRPLVDEGIVVVNSSLGVLSAYEAETGEQLWSFSNNIPNLTLRGDSSPISISGGIFWGMANGRVGAAYIDNGNIIWQQTISNPKGGTEIARLVDIDSTPVVSGSMLYAVGYNGKLVAIDLHSGRAVWKRSYSSSTDILVVGSYLFLITDEDHVVALDARSGTRIWININLEHRQLTPPALISGYVVVGDRKGYLHWLNHETGEFVAQQRLDDSGISVPPIQVDDGYLVITRSGSLSKRRIQ
ncbi:outer membrane protein assembly factor BamB [Candidatus Enterovibrio escicola]|uniref:outer membrane protein assembly factor BamB n=1 Tax=Candidatus Enterovibrio escicola TaxID=1927127 RepID=UPI001681AD33|nr:outer membrane protein assembly factor BamB [Candidatus Enterovibrio escacola]